MRPPGTVTRLTQKSTNGRLTGRAAGLVVFAVASMLTLAPAAASSVPEDAAPVATAPPLALSTADRAWARTAVSEKGREIARLRRLHAALTAGLDAGVHDDAFAIRFVAFARELGVPAYFVLVDAPAATTDRGLRPAGAPTLAAGYGLDGRVVVFTTDSVSRPPHGRLEVLDDRKAVAVIHRNAGAALLRAGDAAAAIERLETAVRLDPDMASAWSILGGALRRAGQTTQALDAYERSISLILARR